MCVPRVLRSSFELAVGRWQPSPAQNAPLAAEHLLLGLPTGSSPVAQRPERTAAWRAHRLRTEEAECEYPGSLPAWRSAWLTDSGAQGRACLPLSSLPACLPACLPARACTRDKDVYQYCVLRTHIWGEAHRSSTRSTARGDR